MKKTISIIAASLLTATVVFTGCGGGGSSTTGGTSSSSSSTPQITPKTVTVADGYVIGATVKSGSETAIATTAGHYQFADASKVTGTIVSTGGTNDLNENGQADTNEPAAPTLKAPASYANVTPMTTLMVEGSLTAQEVINYYNTVYGLNLTTLDFDPVKADAKTKAEVVALGYLLTVMQNSASVAGVRDSAFPENSSNNSSTSSSSSSTSSTQTTGGGAFPENSAATTSSSTESNSSSVNSSESSSSSACLPGRPCENSSSSTEESSSSQTASDLSIESIVNAIKQGITLESAFAEQSDVLTDIKTKVKEGKVGSTICNFVQHKVCNVEDSSSSSIEDSNGSNSSSACLPGRPCENSSSSAEESNNSATSSSSSTSSTQTTGGGAFPENSAATTSSSTESNSSSVNSSESSSSNNGSTGPFPDVKAG